MMPNQDFAICIWLQGEMVVREAMVEKWGLKCDCSKAEFLHPLLCNEESHWWKGNMGKVQSEKE